MFDRLATLVLRWFKVPPEPHLPAGDPASARVFRAGRNYFRLLLFGWLVRQLLAALGLIAATIALNTADVIVRAVNRRHDPTLTLWGHLGADLLLLLEPLSWFVYLVQLPISYQIMKLNYALRWYIVTDRAVRLRDGIMTLNEMTFSLANVQDLSIKQGPLQRLLGLADVELRTAGGGGSGSQAHGGKGQMRDLHVGRFHSVDNAEEIRELVKQRMRAARDSGLGDPDDRRTEAAAAGTSRTIDDALAELLAESRALRQVAER